MSDSRISIMDGAFTVRTGDDLVTKFNSLESAASQIALLHEMIERAHDSESELRALLATAVEAYVVNGEVDHRGCRLSVSPAWIDEVSGVTDSDEREG